MKDGITFAEHVERRKEQGDVWDMGYNHYGSLIIHGQKPRGVAVIHAKPDGDLCGAAAFWDVSHYKPGTEPITWTLHSLEPLDISPSLLCLICGDHGFIRGGKWIPA